MSSNGITKHDEKTDMGEHGQSMDTVKDGTVSGFPADEGLIG